MVGLLGSLSFCCYKFYLVHRFQEVCFSYSLIQKSECASQSMAFCGHCPDVAVTTCICSCTNLAEIFLFSPHSGMCPTGTPWGATLAKQCKWRPKKIAISLRINKRNFKEMQGWCDHTGGTLIKVSNIEWSETSHWLDQKTLNFQRHVFQLRKKTHMGSVNGRAQHQNLQKSYQWLGKISQRWQRSTYSKNTASSSTPWWHRRWQIYKSTTSMIK